MPEPAPAPVLTGAHGVPAGPGAVPGGGFSGYGTGGVPGPARDGGAYGRGGQLAFGLALALIVNQTFIGRGVARVRV
ncbi:hypothetical protein AB0C60_35110, partial [Streptomyces sp. NPDC048845]